jgi:hypothetical protein
VTIIFAGAGGFPLDARLWRDHLPAPIAVRLLLVTILVAVVTRVALNVSNPIPFDTPAS